jgi:predicted DNA-binding transcriptional regulator YafY
MSRVERLFRLVDFLRGRGVVTAAEIADEFGVSPRTVYRDMRELAFIGFPVRGEPGVGYLLERAA